MCNLILWSLNYCHWMIVEWSLNEWWMAILPMNWHWIRILNIATNRVPYPSHTALLHTTSEWLGGTPIYFLGRDVPTVRVSFSGSSVLNRVYIFRFSCLEQGRPRKSSLFLPLQSHNFRWFRAPSLKCVKTQTYVPFLVFWIRPAWSSLEQGEKLQHFLLDRVAKFTSFVS